MSSESQLEGKEIEAEDMTFLEHLEELRNRVVRCLIPFLPAFCGAWVLREPIYAALAEPLREALAAMGLEQKLYFTNPLDTFVVYIKQSVVVGLMVSSPWVFWQVWSFISPGLYSREKRFLIPFVVASTLFFVGGAMFGYFIVFPLSFQTLIGLAGDLPSGMSIESMITITEYTSLTLKLLIAFGTVFEVPVAITFMAAADIVNWRQLLAFGRWWVVVAFVISALLTPQDVSSMVLMAVPLVVLYYLSTVVAYVIDKRRRAKYPERYEYEEPIDDDDE